MQDHLVARRAARTRGRDLDHQMPGMGQPRARGLLLATQVIEEFSGRPGLQAIGRFQLLAKMGIVQTRVRRFQKIGQERGKVPVARAAVADPERGRHRAGRRGRGEHVRVGDALDAPVLCAESENLPEPRLPDEHLVELAELRPALLAAQRIIAPVGDDPARGVEPHERTLARRDRPVHAVHSQKRRQLADARGSVAPGQHAERQVEGGAREVMVGPDAAHGLVERVHAPGLHAA